MVDISRSFRKIIVVAIAATIAASCNNNTADIPFPVKDSGFQQPVTVPLRFTAPKKINWVTTKMPDIRHTIKKLDIDAVPSTPYDSMGFKPLSQAPTETRFNFNSVRSVPFNLEKIPSSPLHFKTYILTPPVTTKAGLLTPKSGTDISLFAVGKTQGFNGETITGLFKDKSGFIWASSENGLFRFDGENVMTYTKKIPWIVKGMTEDLGGRIWYQDNQSIGIFDPGKGTLSVCTDSIYGNLSGVKASGGKGLIWVSYPGRKTTIIDPDNKTYKQPAGMAAPIATGAFTVLNDGDYNIWYADAAHGLDIINTAAGTIKHLGRNEGMASDTVTAMAVDKTGLVWVSGASGGLSAVDIRRGVIKHYDELKKPKNGALVSTMSGASKLFCDGQGYVWMLTLNNGLAVIDPEKNLVKFFNMKDFSPVIFPPLNIVQDDGGRIWESSLLQSGINLVAQNGKLVYPFSKSEPQSMAEDGLGNIWIVTAEGVSIMEIQNKLIRHLNKTKGLGGSYFVNSVTAVNDNIWVAGYDGLYIIDPAKKTIENTGIKQGLAGIFDGLDGMFLGDKGNIWIKGRPPVKGQPGLLANQMIAFIDPAKKTVSHISYTEGLSDSIIIDVKQDKQGLVWATTIKNGIDIIDAENGTVRYLDTAANYGGNKILLPGSDGRMWIGTNHGIEVADVKRGTLTNITTAQGLPGNNITSLCAYKGSILASTDDKVAIITPPALADGPSVKEPADTAWRIRVLAKSELLANDENEIFAYNICMVTKNGKYLWGSMNGITIINQIEEKKDYAATYITGLGVMNQPQYFVNRQDLNNKDTIWDSDTFYVKGRQPVNGTTTLGLQWDSVAGPYNMPVNLRIPYNQNTIQFQYAQAHMGRMDTTFYCYMLQGVDRQWSAFTNKTVTENYLNLQPGSYTFKVSSKGASGRWCKPVTFSFTITPPWWQTWWAYTLYVLLLAGGLWAFVYWRGKRLIQANRALEEKVKQRTTEVQEQKEEIIAQRDNLEKTLEELKSTQKQLIQSEKMASLGELTAGIAHEIQNPLNFVNNFSEVSNELLGELKTERQKPINERNEQMQDELLADIHQNLEKINHHGKRADSIVKGMLQHSRKSTGHKELTDINALAEEYMRLSYHGLRAKDKEFNAILNTDFDKTIGKINIIPQDIGRVLLNLFNNAFYAVTERQKVEGEGYKAAVSVATKKVGDKVEIRVADNGSGIPQKIIDKIFQPFFTTKPTGQGTGLGLSLSYDIVKAHSGEIRVETNEARPDDQAGRGEGTEFIIILPLEHHPLK